MSSKAEIETAILDELSRAAGSARDASFRVEVLVQYRHPGATPEWEPFRVGLTERDAKALAADLYAQGNDARVARDV